MPTRAPVDSPVADGCGVLVLIGVEDPEAANVAELDVREESTDAVVEVEVNAANEAESVKEIVVATTVCEGTSVPVGAGITVTLVVMTVSTEGAVAVASAAVESMEAVAASELIVVWVRMVSVSALIFRSFHDSVTLLKNGTEVYRRTTIR